LILFFLLSFCCVAICSPLFSCARSDHVSLGYRSHPILCDITLHSHLGCLVRNFTKWTRGLFLFSSVLVLNSDQLVSLVNIESNWCGCCHETGF
jgi:hypothetical protein